MAEEKKVYEKVVIKGIALYPKLNIPEKFNEKENKSVPDIAGDFSTKLIVKVNDVPEGLLVKIDNIVDKAHKETVAAAKLKNIKPELIEAIMPYSYNEEGDVVFKLKAKGQYTNSNNELKENKIRFFDAANTSINPENVRSGSILSVNATMIDYGKVALKKAGLSLFINAVKIHKLVSGQDGSDFFEEDEEYITEKQEELDEISF